MQGRVAGVRNQRRNRLEKLPFLSGLKSDLSFCLYIKAEGEGASEDGADTKKGQNSEWYLRGCWRNGVIRTTEEKRKDAALPTIAARFETLGVWGENTKQGGGWVSMAKLPC